MLKIHNTSTPVVEERRKREGVGQGGKESEKREREGGWVTNKTKECSHLYFTPRVLLFKKTY